MQRTRRILAPVLILLLPPSAAAALVINEVCYDPPGADAGLEFVELINTGAAAVSLEGCRLEFANGAVGPEWSVRWTGQAGERLEPGSFYLVVDRGWVGPAADAEVRLGLQNGPDALRLVRADGSTDLVGWGDLAWPDLYERRPHPGAAGQSLARRPDGRDTDDNAADLTAAGPTPGRRNWADFAASLVGVRWDPPSLTRGGQALSADLRLVNTGVQAIRDAVLHLHVGSDAAARPIGQWAVDQEITCTLTLRPAGGGRLPASLLLQGPAPRDTCRLDLGRVQVGPSEVRLTEVMAAPTSGGEWCELVNAGSVPRNLADLALRDEDGAWRRLPERMLAPGDCLLIAQDAAALADWLAALAAEGADLLCEPAPPLQLGGWPSLNNTAPAGRPFADRLHLGDADGTVLDHATIGEQGGAASAGRSHERQADLSWRTSSAAVGATPGCLPAPPPALADGGLLLSPNPCGRGLGDGSVTIHLRVPDDAVGWTLRVYDLWGRLVRDLGGDDLGAGQRRLAWDCRDESGRELAAGGYVVVVHWRLAGGSLRPAGRRLLAIRDRSS